MTVDWSDGNRNIYAASNTAIVGAEIAKLINSLIFSKNMSASDFHLIGHSLGAHASGYAGQRIKNLARITGFSNEQLIS